MRTHEPDNSQKRSLKRGVSGKLAVAIERMVELGEPWDEAARAAGMTVRAMRKALEKKHVISAVRARRAAFREGACAGNVAKLVELRDTAENSMARLGAIKTLEGMVDTDDEQSLRAATVPGIIIVVGQGPLPPGLTIAPQPAPLVIDAKPPPIPEDR
jgi:hypothetical protein